MAELKVFIKVVIFLVLTNFIFIKPASASGIKCIKRERQALLKFKQDVVDELGVLSSWGNGEGESECCEWYGVKCSNITGHVISLILLNLSFSLKVGGKINGPALIELQHLEYLSLGFNSLQVDNLEWLPHLSSLRFLDLSGNNLHETKNWLHQISKLSFLEQLFLTRCQLPHAVSAFDIFANSSLSSLTDLDLSFNDLSSFAMFGSLFNSSTLLTYIDLSGNKFHGSIPASFGSLNFLEELFLGQNMLNEIPLSLGNLTHLHSLKLSRNAFNQSVDQIFQSLSGRTSKSLEEIDLSNNQLFGPLSDITHFSSLHTLMFANNQLSGFHPQSPDRPSRLVVLDLSNNKIGGSLPDLRAFSSLKQLSLSENQIKGLPRGNWRLPELKDLDLSSNSLKGTITDDQLLNLANLTSLDLSYNSLSFHKSSDWSPPFQLSELYLSNCNIGPEFPKWLRTQTSLFKLDMSFAGISSDTLPTWLWDNPNLLVVNLSHNHISGRILNQPLDYRRDLYIDLSNNNLSGPIPSFLFHSRALILSKNKFSGSISHSCNAPIDSNMIELDLSDNQFAGELPDCWRNKGNLAVVNLSNNNFSGQVPRTLGNMPSLLILHLRNNSFTGKLPPSLKNCTQLRMLDVGGNKLTGTIPKWIGTHLTNLKILSLRFNQFHGSIDTTVCRLTHIEILDLSRNNLSGKIPNCLNSFTSLIQKNSFENYIPYTLYGFPNIVNGLINYVDNILVQWKGQVHEYRKLGMLKGIDLSSNSLVGTIPHEFSDLRGLVFLNLSRNHLTGNIIPSIGQIEMLEWLDLSRNKLSGAIPNSLVQLHFLSVLDLSYNNLTGKIPLGTQLQSFNSAAYAGNNQLCGPPLMECLWDSPYPSSIDREGGNNEEEDDGLINRDFYICLAFGFITGFWMIVGTLFVKHSWRRSYFNFLNKIGDWMYVTSAIYVARLKRKFLA